MVIGGYDKMSKNWYSNSFLIKKAEMILDLKDKYLENPDILKNMEEIEEKNFIGKNKWLASDEEDLEEDFTEYEDFTSSGIFDDSSANIHGYIYGFTLTLDFLEEEDVDIDPENIHCFSEECQDKELFIDKMMNKIKNKKVFYISNFAINKEKRFYIKKILVDFVEKIHASSYEYVAFDALEDTQEILTNKDGKMNLDRINFFGFEPVASMPTGYSVLYIMKKTSKKGFFSKIKGFFK